MGGINRNPGGLLDFLQTQSGGRNPDFLQESVRPTIDIEKFYYPDRLRGFNEPFNLSQGQLDFVEVPEGQVWALLMVGSEVDIDSTSEDTQVSYFLERIPGQGLNGILIGNGAYHDWVSGGAPAELADTLWLPTPLLITAGQRVVIKMALAQTPPRVGNFYGLFVLLQDNNA